MSNRDRSVACELSCTFRRDPLTTSATHYHHEQMNHIMDQVSRRSGGRVQSHIQSSRASQPYDDHLIVAKYTIRTFARSQQEACQKVTTAYTEEIRSRSQTGVVYYLRIIADLSEEEVEFYIFGQSATTFSLGFLSEADKFNVQFDYEKELKSRTNKNPKVTIACDREEISVNFVVSQGLRYHKVGHGISPTTEVYRLTISFKDLSSSLLVYRQGNKLDLCFLTNAPLQLWRTQFDVTDLDKVNFDKTNWLRTCSIKSGEESANLIGLNKSTLGGCNALKLSLEDSPFVDKYTLSHSLDTILKSLESTGKFFIYNTVLKYLPRSTFQPAPSINRPRSSDIDWMLAAIHSINYRVQYQLQDVQVGQKFMTLVRMEASGNEDRRRHLMNALQQTHVILCQDVDHLYHIDTVLQFFLNAEEDFSELISRSQSRMVKKIIITPSRTVYLAPSLMHDNRILREFEEDYAVSCSFQNDDMTGIMGTEENITFIKETVGDVLQNGVVVANRHYQFLGCSGSQLKNNGCWLYAADSKGRTAQDIRNWMGDLKLIRNPGTYLSRMGQCFSDTTRAVLDSDIEIDWEDDDVEGGMDPREKKYCFSDGVGRISEECLKQVFTRLEINVKVLPSAFQVRLGGAKGMLTLDKRLQGKTIKVRKSMLKFQTAHRAVEVMRRTQPTPLYLNKQVITILSQLRQPIPDHVFIRFLYTMLHRLADILMDEDKALSALSQSDFRCPYAKLRKAGVGFTTDPFFRGILKTIICARLGSLKLRIRIEIPNDYGRSMLGVMDEEGVLEYGEVFVQYSSNMLEPSQQPIVLTGDVVVSKMPALHPGDVRKLRAVNRPELHHLIDCIVFPQKGPRPHPNEMAGSDLDGDEYFVTWHPDLIFKGENEKPMDFPSVKKKQQEDEISVKDLTDFFLTSFVNNKIGVISNAHLASADEDVEGIHSKRCLDLARIFSHVIDFNKTGFLPEEVKGRGIFDLIPKRYPDFMGKQDHKETYRSTRILGKLYRICQRIEQSVMNINEKDSQKIETGSNWSVDERLIVAGYETFRPQAERLYRIYANYLDAEQRRYRINSEEELVSACVIKIKGLYGSTEEHGDIEKRLKERMQDIRTVTFDKFEQFLKQRSDFDEHKENKLRMLFASACYAITYKEKRVHRSFPWIFADQLVRILQRSESACPDTPIVQLTKSIISLNIKDAERSFLRYKLQQPADEGLTKLYHVLINWGQKSRFLPPDGQSANADQLSMGDFVVILDRAMEDEEVQANSHLETGPFLCRLLTAITRLSEDLTTNDRSLPKTPLINMKRQILLCHHQLAREPSINCLLLGQTRISRSIHIGTDTWSKIESNTDKLRRELKKSHDVKLTFRAGRRQTGYMKIQGLDNDVFDFNEFWFEAFNPGDYISDSESESEEGWNSYGDDDNNYDSDNDDDWL